MNILKKIKLNKLSATFWGYFIVVLAIVAPWFLNSGYLFFTDFVWGPNIRLDWANSWFLFNLLVKGLSFIFPVYFLEKLFIAGTIILILLGGRLLVKTVLKYYNNEDESNFSRGLIFVLSLFALFNPFVYDRALYSQSGVLIAYGCLLFIAAYLFRAARDLDFKYLWRSAIFSGLAFLFSVHFIFLFAPFYLLFLIRIFLKRRELKATGNLKKFWLAVLLSVFIILVINTNWLISLSIKASPLTSFVEQGITNQDLIAFQTAGRNGLETFSNVLLMSGFWGKEQFRYLDLTDQSGWQRSFIFLAPVILYGFYLSLRRRSRPEKIFSFGLIIIFFSAVFLAIGIKSPLTRDLTLFLYDNLPLYKGLREPQKWVAVIIPIYLFYLTLGAWRLSRVKVIANNIIAGGLILGAIIIMQAPSLLWGFNRQAIPTPYPDDWYDVNSLLVNRSSQSYGCSDKILFLPWHMYMSFNWARKIIANPAPYFFTCPVLSGTNMEWGGIYDNSRLPEGTVVSSWLKDQGQGGAMSLTDLKVRYIILAKELDFTSYLWINDLTYIKPLLETKTLLVYEIKF